MNSVPGSTTRSAVVLLVLGVVTALIGAPFFLHLVMRPRAELA